MIKTIIGGSVTCIALCFLADAGHPYWAVYLAFSIGGLFAIFWID